MAHSPVNEPVKKTCRDNEALMKTSLHQVQVVNHNKTQKSIAALAITVLFAVIACYLNEINGGNA